MPELDGGGFHCRWAQARHPLSLAEWQWQGMARDRSRKGAQTIICREPKQDLHSIVEHIRAPRTAVSSFGICATLDGAVHLGPQIWNLADWESAIGPDSEARIHKPPCQD